MTGHRRQHSGLRDVAEWVAYLREIGVREMHAARPRILPAAPEARRQERHPRSDVASAPPAAPEQPPPRAAQPTQSSLQPGLHFSEPAPDDPAAALVAIRSDLGECTRCALHEGRTNIVFGVGNASAGLMFVGEGPGADEDLQGEPFVGRAGKKLDEMIAAIGLSREQVYIANVVKCRPPGNRDPRPEEVATCSPFLFRQIAAIRPRVIVALGSPAAKTLLNTRVGITRLRGNWHEYRGIPVMPTYHPAYLLRAYTPENRRKVWEDLKAARDRLGEAR